MARFNDLNEQDRIQYVKDGFVLILEQLAKDPVKLKNYIKLEKPKLHVASLETVPEKVSDADKTAIESRNKTVLDKVSEQNEKLEAEFKNKEENFKKIEAIVSKLQKKEGCLCGTCINISITNSAVPPELDVLIEVARKEAEERAY